MTARPGGAPLPRRDFILIPLIALLTVLALSALAEVAARSAFNETGSETCGMVSPSGLQLMRPNCTSRRKSAEGPEFTNSYNDCGYRTPEPCQSRSPGSLRVALMGASQAQGMKVRYPDTFAALLSDGLSRACGRPVEFQNMGVPAAPMLDIARRIDEALSLHPELVLIAVSPIELRNSADPRAPPPGPGPAVAAPPPPRSIVARLSDLAAESHILVAAQHFLFQDDAVFAKLYLLHGEEADYLRKPYRRGWEQRLANFELILAGIADKTRAAGVPLMVVMTPQHVQTALLDPANLQPGIDPFEIGRRVAALAAAHGVLFEDELPAFAVPHAAGEGFYPVDGHMDASGHALLARSLQAHLLQDVPLFRGCGRS